jgi:predicted secreted protein
MKRITRLIFNRSGCSVGLIVLLVLLFQGSSGQTNSPTNKLSASMQDELAAKEITMTVKQGEQFTIRLRAQAGTGYSWKLVNHSPGLTEQTQKETYENSPDSKPGSAGIQTFYFKAIKAGMETISFVYLQPFVKPVPENAQQKKVHVTIQ